MKILDLFCNIRVIVCNEYLIYLIIDNYTYIYLVQNVKVKVIKIKKFTIFASNTFDHFFYLK